MEVSFASIIEHVISIEAFSMKWRFTEENYNQLPQLHLDQLKPLNHKASRFIWDFINDTNLHYAFPFKKDFFKTVDKTEILDDNKKEIKKWLYQKGLPLDKQVYLSWDSTTSMIVPWKLLIKYFDDFYYTSSDDLTVIDQSLNWALLFHHEDNIYFGANEEFKLNATSDEIDFLW